MACRRHRFGYALRRNCRFQAAPGRLRQHRRRPDTTDMAGNGVFRMRGNHRTDDAHRRLSRSVRTLLPAPHRIVPTRHRHNGPLAHSESDVRPPARRTAHQSRCCGQIRVPQSPDSHPARSRRQCHRQPRSGRMEKVENQGRPSIIRVRRRLRAVSPAHRK